MSRQRFIINLQAETPLLAGKAQAVGNIRETDLVIPGRTLRGALAAFIRENHFDAFAGLFETDQQVHFGSLLLSHQANTLPFTPITCVVNVIQKTALDTLIRQYASEVALTTGSLGMIDDLRDLSAEPYTLAEADPRLTTTTHVAINRQRHVAQDGQLYVRQGMMPATPEDLYVGYIDVPDELIGQLSNLLENAQFRLGANRSRGMGLVHVKRFEPVSNTPLNMHVEQFNRLLFDNLAFYERVTGVSFAETAAARNNQYFTLDLHGPAILTVNGVPARDPVLPGVSIVRRWIEWQTESGWHAAAALPRRSVLAVYGIYLCRFDNSLPDYDLLHDLETNGIGQRREAGYGQLTICHPIHEQIGL